METRYGIISDIHRIDPSAVETVFKILKDNKKIDALVLNGDICGDYFRKLKPEDYFSYLLESLGKLGIESYILCGSHEEVLKIEPVAEYYASKHSNLVYVVKNPKIKKQDHELVFLAGSDWRPEHTIDTGYALMRGTKTGLYRSDAGFMRVINMDDLRKLVTDSEKTVLFSHVPRNFNNENCVDIAYFGEVQSNFQLNGDYASKGSVYPGPVGEKLVARGLPIKMKRENRGNKELGEILDELGIKKQITGHFHESVHKANNRKGESIKENEFIDELFWDASYMDDLKIGILTVKENKVAYENVDLNEYAKR